VYLQKLHVQTEFMWHSESKQFAASDVPDGTFRMEVFRTRPSG
jgi:hypothetical protein